MLLVRCFETYCGAFPAQTVSRLALSRTIKGALPPSSIDNFCTLCADLRINSRPTAVEPVNDSFRIVEVVQKY